MCNNYIILLIIIRRVTFFNIESFIRVIKKKIFDLIIFKVFNNLFINFFRIKMKIISLLIRLFISFITFFSSPFF